LHEAARRIAKSINQSINQSIKVSRFSFVSPLSSSRETFLILVEYASVAKKHAMSLKRVNVNVFVY